MSHFIESGFDIINPVQINASGTLQKEKYGDKLVFWGGGVDTQGAFGTPTQVRDQVRKQCEILNKDGGFVFNTVHNIQANVPFENVIGNAGGLERAIGTGHRHRAQSSASAVVIRAIILVWMNDQKFNWSYLIGICLVSLWADYFSDMTGL